ncbi:hypothetical protein, partial [Limosilactobacillus fermentum]
KEMTLPQQNTASARPTSFYYLMCQLDRAQYPELSHPLKYTPQKKATQETEWFSWVAFIFTLANVGASRSP